MAGIDFRGVNHLALVCKDMARTVDFYSGVLGMPLIKTIEIPGGGQHFVAKQCLVGRRRRVRLIGDPNFAHHRLALFVRKHNVRFVDVISEVRVDGHLRQPTR